MSKVTGKYRGSIPKALARMTLRERLRLFDAATARQLERERRRRLPLGKGRGWTRGDLYTR